MIRLTQHAVTALLRRSLQADWIEAAILGRDWTALNPDPVLTRPIRLSRRMAAGCCGLSTVPMATTS